MNEKSLVGLAIRKESSVKDLRMSPSYAIGIGACIRDTRSQFELTMLLLRPDGSIVGGVGAICRPLGRTPSLNIYVMTDIWMRN